MAHSNWIRAAEAIRILGGDLTPKHMRPIAAAEGIRMRELPATYVRFYKPDVEALARRCVVGAPISEGELAAV